MNKSVYIIILNWNDWQTTAECVESCRKLVYPNFSVLIVDNGSTDGSEARLRERFPGIEIMQTAGNLGFAGGNNFGICRALQENTDFVWLLNNDTIVDPECLSQMVDTALEDERIGMVGSKIYYHHAPDTLWFCGGEIDFESGGRTRHLGQDEKDRGNFDQQQETAYITGCSILARGKMIEEIGMLEEAYFLYFEDADWSLRARRKGWRLVYQPAARLWHKEGAQTEKVYSNRFIYYFLRNRFYFVRRFAPQKMFRCHFLQAKTALFFIKQALISNTGSVLKTIHLILAAYADFFIKGKMGIKEVL